MNINKLNTMVEQVRDDPVPSCPGDLEQNVLRKIRISTGRDVSLTEWLSDWLIRPVFLAASLALVALSTLTTTTIISLVNNEENPVTALGFEVFTEPIVLPTDH